MASIKSAMVLGLVAAVSATFTIPHGQPDGLYTVSGTGANEVHQRIQALSDMKSPPPHVRARDMFGATLQARKSDIVYCETGKTEIASSADIQAAEIVMSATCDASGDFIKPHGGAYLQQGDVVLYVCNYAGAYQHCKSDEIYHDIGAIQAQCKNVEGHYMHPDWAKLYGYANPGRKICT